MSENKKFKFSFELGTKSIGWAVYELNENLNPIAIAKTGVRIFSDGRQPKTGESLAVVRRIARVSRRKRDRFISRKQALIRCLTDFGFMPKEELERQKLKNLDVYKLRAISIKEKINIFEIGRVFYHLNQRRGFLSNRKSSNDNEYKTNALRIKELKKHIAENNFNSLGDYLFSLNQVKKPLRFIKDSQYYPDREIYKAEFDLIVSVQKLFYPHISEETWLKIKSIIFYQRPLRSNTELIGQCVVFPDKIRAPKSSIYFQRFRLLQSIVNLKAISEHGQINEIAIECKSKLYQKLSTCNELSFDSVKRILNLDPDISLNLENIKNKKMLGDGVSKQIKDVLEEAYNES